MIRLRFRAILTTLTTIGLAISAVALSGPPGDRSPGPAAADAAVPDLSQGLNDLKVVEIMYNPAGGTEYEFIELKNVGPTALNMGGVSFSQGISFTFPAGTAIAPGHYAVLANDAVAFANRYPGVIADGEYLLNLSNGGERLLLEDPSGGPIVDMTYDDQWPWPIAADGLGYSLVIVDERADPDQGANWRASTFPNGSPGADDPMPVYSDVVINELLANSLIPYEDAIELFNAGDQPVHIGGWFLSDDPLDLAKFRIPDGTVIPPGGYAAFYEAQFNANPGVPPSFGLNARGEELFLASANPDGTLTGYTDSLQFGASETNVSLGAIATSQGRDLTALIRPTFGVSNPATVAQFRNGQGAPNTPPIVGPVVINEIMYNPDLAGDEFIELHNISGLAVTLGDPANPEQPWRIASGVSFTLPVGTIVPPQGYLLVVGIDPDLFRTKHDVPPAVTILGPYGGTLSNGGETVSVSRPSQGSGSTTTEIIADSITYGDAEPWPLQADGNGPSLERILPTAYGNDPSNWSASTGRGSPGRRNSAWPWSNPLWTHLPMITAP